MKTELEGRFIVRLPWAFFYRYAGVVNSCGKCAKNMRRPEFALSVVSTGEPRMHYVCASLSSITKLASLQPASGAL
jgi:hypothetical protein